MIVCGYDRYNRIYNYRLYCENRKTERYYPMKLFVSLPVSWYFLFSVCALATEESNIVSGRVVDADTREPLAFVHMVINDSNTGVMTDIDGFFTIQHREEVRFLQLSYVGYERKTYTPDHGHRNHLILLQRKPIELQEVVVLPGENPAHRIIENAIRNRDMNNPEKLRSFSYESYNKFVFSGEVTRPDDRETTEKPDTATSRIERYLEDHHFFLMETVTERKFRYPNRSNETILASRISGIQHPIFAILISQMQSFSFYDDYIAILGNEYLSPLAPGSTRRYFFMLEDTTYVNNDTIFIISYRPSKGRNFEGLRGVLYIHTDNWALQSVIAEPANAEGDTRVRIQQNYERIDGRTWFPVQLNTDFEFFADGSVQIQGLDVFGTGRTYLQNIRVDPPLARRDFSPFHIEFSPETIVENDAFWDDFRRDTLTARDLNTYHYLDSVARENDLDGRIERLQTLFSGFWQLGKIDAELSQILRYNQYEGFRPGMALRTNDRFSRRIRLNGFTAYGFGDNTLKYGGGGSIMLDRLRDLRLGYQYSFDVHERGGSEFLQLQHGLLNPGNLRAFFIKTMDPAQEHRAWLQSIMYRNFLTMQIYTSTKRIDHIGDYRYAANPMDQRMDDGRTNYTELGARVRFAYGERFILTPTQMMAMGGNHPVLQLNVAKGLEGPLNGDYSYWRVEANLRNRFSIPMLGRQTWIIRAGYFAGEAPWHKRFNTPASGRRFAVTTPESFSTMRMDEFVSDRYIALFWYHHFENLLIRGNGFNPQFVITTNIGWGDMHDREKHLHTSFKTMDKGYFESGVAVLDLLGSGFTSLGIEFAYRYGPYAFPSFKDNFTLRLSYSFLFR